MESAVTAVPQLPEGRRTMARDVLSQTSEASAMFTRILCAVDFTLFSHHAIEYAVALARTDQSRVTALHVVTEPVVVFDLPLCGAAVTPELLSQLERQAARALAEAGATSIDAIAVRGEPADEIVRTARHLPADLIVMATHGRMGLARGTCGTVTAKVLSDAPCPILAVPRPLSSTAKRQGRPFRRILCAVDFSPASIHALKVAEDLARTHRSALVVVHVTQSAPHEAMVASGRGTDGESPTGRAFWQRRLHQIVRSELAFSECVTERVVEGTPAEQILRTAAVEQCDLIVLGGHRGNPVTCAMNTVVRESTCPVLTVKAINQA
jgi:nucleotide-binding universal stress UspA family protein